ncbi:MAG: hypothetical protein NNA25_08795 [Nitrospira sp.]|nr:hypothetical protein [Nitrospira sp.]
MTSPSSASASDYRFLFLMIPSLFILSLAIGLFEFSSNITVDNFHYLTNRLMHPDSERSTHSFNPSHFLVEVKARYLWLTTVVIMLVAGLYASILCGMIVYQSHPRPRMAVVAGVGTILAAMGLFSLLALDETPTLYRVVFVFSYENLRQAGPERISPELLRYAKTVVSLINVEAVVVPVVAILAACSTLAPPLTGDQADPDFCATQMKRLKEVLGASSAVLVAGVLPMGAWLRWPAALISDKAAHEAVPRSGTWSGYGRHAFWGRHLHLDVGIHLPSRRLHPGETSTSSLTSRPRHPVSLGSGSVAQTARSVSVVARSRSSIRPDVGSSVGKSLELSSARSPCPLRVKPTRSVRLITDDKVRRMDLGSWPVMSPAGEVAILDGTWRSMQHHADGIRVVPDLL